ncbi:MAG TPA: GNAT family N-acetyltransferase [Acidobacteriaceae bacterium]|jgi:ribosomal protein S18 acetylase RimI-like enzyme
MSSPPKFEVLDLRHFSASQLRTLLIDEATHWQRRLNWDYRDSTELLLEYLDSRVLPGFAAVERGRVLGYTFTVMESAKAVIGDLYALGETGRPGNPVCETLLRHLIEMLQATPAIDRIEAQLMMFPAGALSSILHEHGFQTFPRTYMQWDFHNSRPQEPSRDSLLPGSELLAWRPEFYDAAADLIHRAYAGHIDSDINDQYRSTAGSLRFLHNVVRFPGCGVFEADNSWVVRDEASGQLQALLLSSRLRHDVGHVTQVCVAPEYRGHGLGRTLLQQCATSWERRGGSALSLTVTESNATARRVYDALGFKGLQRFEAMVWQGRK